ncbi:hypothetical protein MLD38_018574 [Melastoma candidum]|uniref:Uncharacterized protein n=1 Tax=Melastoma candidum TaxID=119954 RepID=A0ACB9QXS0_9MYRT|nr:hypothetical protein MLD38_018574 [Melastoma candidum]
MLQHCHRDTRASIVVGDLEVIWGEVAAVAGDKGEEKEKQVYAEGHNLGAIVALYLCLYRPDRVKALVNMSVALTPRDQIVRPVNHSGKMTFKSQARSRLSSPRSARRESSRRCGSLQLHVQEAGFTGGLNYYHTIDHNWELTTPWTGAQINVPVKFIIGDEDLTYNTPGSKDFIFKGTLKEYVPLLDEVIMMEGVARFIHEERPQEVTQLIHGFFQKIQFGHAQSTARKPCCIM